MMYDMALTILISIIAVVLIIITIGGNLMVSIIVDLLKIQKSALRLILKERYIDYKHALNVMKLDTLEIRREKLCLKFAKACVKNDKLYDMFPKSRNPHSMDLRHNDKFMITKARTERLQRSAIVNMQRLLNKDDLEKRRIFRQINDIAVPVNYGCMQSISL